MNARWLIMGTAVMVGVALLTCRITTTSTASLSFDASEAASLLAAVRAGCEAARSRVSTRVGTIVIQESYWDGDRETLETETTYSIVTDGAKERVTASTRYIKNESLPMDPTLKVNAPGTVTTAQFMFDGEKVVSYSPAARGATITDLNSTLASDFRSIKQLIQQISPGVPDLDRPVASPRYVRRGPFVVGREIVGGDECILVEISDVWIDADGQEISSYERFWIAPQKGFVTLKAEAGGRGGRYGYGVVFAETEAKAIEYPDGLWGLSQIWVQQYGLDGPPHLESRIAVTMADDYRLNAPVTDDMLTINLPSGTKVRNELIDSEYTVP